MQDTELIMKYHGLGPAGVKAMSDPLEVYSWIFHFLLYFTLISQQNIYTCIC